MNIDKQEPREWRTFQRKTVTMETIDHQHLSNIYWFHRIVQNTEATWVLPILKRRFNGHIMGYRPHIDFKYEIDYLERNGYLTWTENKTLKVGTITYKGNMIGTIDIVKPYEPQLRDFLTESFNETEIRRIEEAFNKLKEARKK